MKRILKITNRVIELIPLLVPASLATFSVVAMFLVVLGVLSVTTVLIFGLPSLLATVLLLHRNIDLSDRQGTSKEKWVFDIFMVVFVGTWCLTNLFFTSQNVFVFRDPAVYTTTAKWVSKNSNLNMYVENPFGKVDGIVSDSPGFRAVNNPEDSRKYPQGMHLLPVLSGLAGRIFGDNGILRLNILLAGAAIFSVYAFSRLVSRPKWAALTTVALSLSLPFIYFSRDNYTELLSIALLFGSLSLFWSAEKSRRTSLWIYSGLMFAAGSLARVDLLLILISVCAYFAVLMISTHNKEGRKALYRQIMLLILAALLVVFLSWVDLRYFSTQYYSVVGKEFYKQLAVAGIVLLAGILFSAFIGNNRKRIEKLYFKYQDYFFWFSTTFFVGLIIMLVSRPLWHVARDNSTRGFARAAIENLQLTLGYDVDPTRTYAETTVNWVVWYLGVTITVLAILGAIICFYKLITKQRKLFIFLSLVLGSTLLYFYNPGIVPDQIWASRRFLVITYPGVVILAAISLTYIESLDRVHTLLKISLLSVLSILILCEPVRVSSKFFTQRLYTPQLSQVYDICKSLPDNAAALWIGEQGSISVQVIRNYCQKPAVYTLKMEQNNLDTALDNARKKGYTPVILFNKLDQSSLPTYVRWETKVVSQVKYKELERTLLGPPKDIVEKENVIIMGVKMSRQTTSRPR